jgi:DNA-binding NarL/FixJ family response regulator
MIIPPEQLRLAVGGFQARFLLACLSSGFVPTVVYAANNQNLLANLYRGMGRTARHCLGVCTTGASAMELIAAVKPGILAMSDDLPDMALDELAVQARTIHPALRTVAFITKLDKLSPSPANPILVSDQDLLIHAETTTLMSMAVVTNTSYNSPTILQHFNERNQKPSPPVEGTFLLTLRERQLLEAYALGLSNQETAKRLGLSVRTVQTYSSNLLQRLGVNNRQKALLRVITLGFNPLEAQRGFLQK